MFDTLKYAKRLELAGLSRDQAEAEINSIAEMIVDSVATKSDLQILRSEIQLVRQELKQDMLSLETRLLVRMGTMLLASTTITVALMAWMK